MKITPYPKNLTYDQKKQFRESGYLAFSDVLNSDQITKSREALRKIVAEMSADPHTIYSPPRVVHDNRSGAVFKRATSQSLFQLESGYDPTGESIEDITAMVRKYMWFSGENEVFQELLSDSGSVGRMVAQLLGDSPVLFQEMALVKPAHFGSEKPWHQDNAYFSMQPLDAIIGVWIALDDATPENGCMYVIPGEHQAGAFQHHHDLDCEINPTLLKSAAAIPVPVPAGGALFFYGMLPHKTPPNRSTDPRRALQFHFHSADATIVDEAAYDRLFVNQNGGPASCRAASKLGF